MRFYENLFKEALTIEAATLDRVVQFYSKLETIYAHLESFRTEHFRKLPPAAKVRAVERLMELTDQCQTLGRITLYSFDIHYPDLGQLASSDL